MKKIMLLFCIAGVCSFCFARDNKTIDTGNRITLGTYNEFNSESKRGLMEIGYDFILSTAYLTPAYNLFDFGIGLKALFIWDDIGRFEVPTVGFALDIPIRIYAPAIKAARLYAEAAIRMIMYTEDYPPNGTWLNVGWLIGPGMEYTLNDGTRLFGTLGYWHSSNGNIYGKERNPAVNGIGVTFGIQFK
jgi:hypothetical protein